MFTTHISLSVQFDPQTSSGISQAIDWPFSNPHHLHVRMPSSVAKLTKTISAHASYLNPKKFCKRAASAEEEEYKAKSAWKLLGARKQAREAMSNQKGAPEVCEIQPAVLSNHAAWRVLGERRHQRLLLAMSTNEEHIADRQSMKKRMSITKPVTTECYIASYLADIRVCEEFNVHLEDIESSLNTACGSLCVSAAQRLK